MKLLQKFKDISLKLFGQSKPTRETNKFEELKRNRLIKKMRSNAIAISTNQIGLHSGTIKMNFLISSITDIRHLDNIELNVFEQFYNEFRIYPIEIERKYYSVQYLAELDLKINRINDEYNQEIIEKCFEIIDKFAYIKNVC